VSAPEPAAPAVGDKRKISGRNDSRQRHPDGTLKARSPCSASSSAAGPRQRHPDTNRFLAAGPVATSSGTSPSKNDCTVAVPVVATPGPSAAAPVAANAKSSVAASGPVPKAAAPSVAKPPSQVVDSGAVPKAAAPIVAQPPSSVAASAQAKEARPSQQLHGWPLPLLNQDF